MSHKYLFFGIFHMNTNYAFLFDDDWRHRGLNRIDLINDMFTIRVFIW